MAGWRATHSRRRSQFSVTYLSHGSNLWRTRIVQGRDNVRTLVRALRIKGHKRSEVPSSRYGVFAVRRVGGAR